MKEWVPIILGLLIAIAILTLSNHNELKKELRSISKQIEALQAMNV